MRPFFKTSANRLALIGYSVSVTIALIGYNVRVTTALIGYSVRVTVVRNCVMLL